jgi:predicted DsbA family dithiol-disulfide isomerase
MSGLGEHSFLNGSLPVLHWYDFLCPFCYIAQHRNEILRRHGFEVVELPFQAHPDIPPGGMASPTRSGPMYEFLEQEAREAGLPLRWPRRLPNTRQALAAAEWVRQNRPSAFPQLRKGLFEAHFVLGEDLGNLDVIDEHASRSGVDLPALHSALADDSAVAAVAEAEMAARKVGVEGTPAWLFGEQLVSGLLPATQFARLVR